MRTGPAPAGAAVKATSTPATTRQPRVFMEPLRMSDVRDRRSEVRGQRSEVRRVRIANHYSGTSRFPISILRPPTSVLRPSSGFCACGFLCCPTMNPFRALAVALALLLAPAGLAQEHQDRPDRPGAER